MDIACPFRLSLASPWQLTFLRCLPSLFVVIGLALTVEPTLFFALAFRSEGHAMLIPFSMPPNFLPLLRIFRGISRELVFLPFFPWPLLEPVPISPSLSLKRGKPPPHLWAIRSPLVLLSRSEGLFL